MNELNKAHCTDNGCRHIKGISCSVKNCYYHDGETYCTAEQIAVGPTNASKSDDTVCATFKPEDCKTCR